MNNSRNGLLARFAFGVKCLEWEMNPQLYILCVLALQIKACFFAFCQMACVFKRKELIQRGRIEGAVQPAGRSVPEHDSCLTSEHSTTARWIRLRGDFEGGGNRSERRKPSKSGWDRLKLYPHTTFVVEMEGVIDFQCVQYRNSIQMVTHPGINPVQQQLISVNRREPVFPFCASRTRRRVRAVSFGPTDYEQWLHWVSEWVIHLHIARNPFLRFAYPRV